MGYVKGIRWTDEMVIQEILKVRKFLDIKGMPSYTQISEVRGKEDLTSKIRSSGGIRKWSKKIGIEITHDDSRIGSKGEEIVEKILKEKGYSVKNVSANRFPYDLLVDNDIKIDVKLSHLYKGPSGNFYSCHIEKKAPICDLYVVVCEKDDGTIENISVIPSKFAHVAQISIGDNKSKYDCFINRWDYIEKYKYFYETIITKEDEI